MPDDDARTSIGRGSATDTSDSEPPRPPEPPAGGSPPASPRPPGSLDGISTRPGPLTATSSEPPQPPAGPAGGDESPGKAPRRWLVPLIAALIGAVVGAGVAGGIVIASDDDDGTGAAAERQPNSSVIERADNIQEVLAQIEPAVVSVRTRTLDLNVFLEPVPSEGAGTGFIIGSDGVIVTNNHVIQDAQRIEVVLADGDTVEAAVLGRDPDFDIAVLKIDRDGLPTATIGNSDELQVGDDVVAIGNALALEGGPTVTLGIISALDRALAIPGGGQLEPLIQTDAAINPGNSGGPLVNAAGEVVGINTAIIGGAENIGFSIEASAVLPIIEELREGVVRSRPFLGVQTISVDPEVVDQFGIEVDEGALVLEVIPGSAAELAGIQRGDVIVEIAGESVEGSEDVGSIVREHEPGEDIEITIVRAGDEQTVTTELGERAVGGSP